MATENQSIPIPVSIQSLLILFNLNDKLIWTISDSFWMFIKRKLDWIILKKDFIWFPSGPVCYFRLATESNDFVVESVRLDFYCFVDELSF